MIDMNRLLKIAKNEKIHMRGLQVLFLLEEEDHYSGAICKELDIKTQNLTSTIKQVGKYIKSRGTPKKIGKQWKLYSLNVRGERFLKRLRGKDK